MGLEANPGTSGKPEIESMLTWALGESAGRESEYKALYSLSPESGSVLPWASQGALDDIAIQTVPVGRTLLAREAQKTGL